jgi:putative ABC transport system permease protein
VRSSPDDRRAASRLRLRDLGSEVLAGLLQRPGRSALTLLGTVLGIGAFVAIVGLSQTASGQIGKQFNALGATQVIVSDSGAAHSQQPTLDFPADASARADRIHGVIGSGVWWQVPLTRAAVTSLPGTSQGGLGLPVTAVSPGLLTASGARLASGVLLNQFYEAHRQDVAVIGRTAAAQLHISNLQNTPAIFIGGQAFTVVGIIAADPRLAQLNFGVAIPASVALHLWGPPSAGGAAQMLIHTRIGAARVVAAQAPVAIRPDDPRLLSAAAPPDLAHLQHTVTTNLNSLFLALAGISLVVGAVGIANTTLVAVLERAGEIGLRRALGARPRHVGIQFLAESTALGLFGGLVGASLGVAAVLAVTVEHRWTALLDPRIVLAAPIAGGVIGLLAGIYPALRASAMEPVEALRQ